MKEPYQKGSANHLDPQSCAGDRKVPGEALAGAHAGQPLSSEITTSACRPCPDKGKATPEGPVRRGTSGRRGVKDPEHAWKLHAREPGDPSNSHATLGGVGRSDKATSRTADMHVAGESDDLIVPTKRANKVGLVATAEFVEGRGSSKGTVRTVDHAPDTEPDLAGRFDGRATAHGFGCRYV
jgi:hypothetical protein